MTLAGCSCGLSTPTGSLNTRARVLCDRIDDNSNNTPDRRPIDKMAHTDSILTVVADV